jgi:hypothetical protein
MSGFCFKLFRFFFGKILFSWFFASFPFAAFINVVSANRTLPMSMNPNKIGGLTAP